MASRDHEEDMEGEEEVEEVYDEGDDEEVEQEQEAPKPAASTSEAPAAPKQPAGIPGLPAKPAGGLGALPPRGMAGGLPARGSSAASGSGRSSTDQAAPSQQPAAAAAATGSPSGMPKLPPKPAGGLPGLPPRGLGAGGLGGAGAAAAAASSAAAPSQQQPAAPAASAASGPRLPPRPGMGAPAAAAPQQPAAAPSLPPRPGGLGAGLGLGPRPAGGAPVPAASAAPAAAAVAAPPAPRPAPVEAVVDPTEEKSGRKIQQRVQELRVALVRAAGRLGLRYDSEQVQQFMAVIQRIETMAGASVYKGAGRRIDLARAAEREAREADAREPDGKLPVKIKVLVLGMTGTGKSELINSLLERPAAKTNAFGESTKRVRVVRGTVNGIQMEFIDTPGLQASSTRQADNRAALKAVKAAYRWHKPNYVFWVDRLDAGRPALGELTLLGLVNEALGAKVWRETMVVLTHAHACRAALGAGYDAYSRQRRNIVSQLLRQAAGDQQVRNPIFVADCHPSCPTNSFGQPVVMEGTQALPWKQVLMMQLVGYRLYEEVQDMFKKAQKGKAGPAAAAKQADLFKQLMRPRLPPVSFYVEQECEGVLKPETWGAMEDPMDAETDDEEAEEFQHAYYRLMYDLACKGNPWAQKEYAAMLTKMEKLRKTYKDAFDNEDVEQMAAGGYEGYVAEGLDLGPTFDPEDGTNHRYVYAVPEADWQIMPTLDYYGYEHEDAINGFVAEYDGQPGNRHGWGGFPLNVHMAVEKDKNNFCLQGEVHLSVVHSVPPFGGSRHITQFNGAWEVLRPNIKDVLYQLEINSFKDGFLARNDHAGVGLMLTRLGEGGRLDKGPMGFGLRLQDTMRIGPLKIEACAAKCTTEAATGAKDTAWGGRAFVLYDHLPGLSMIYDFYQQRTKETDGFSIGGWAANFGYDFELLGAACGVELDYVPTQEALHIDLNVFSCKDYKFAWLLLLPAWNYVKGLWSSWRANAGGEEEGELGEEEGEEEEEAAEDGADGLTQEQRAQLQMQQMLRAMGMAR